MPDMLVKLYELPPLGETLAAQSAAGVAIRKPLGSEMPVLTRWVAAHFSERWASQVERAGAGLPLRCVAAVHEGRFAGFAAYDAIGLGLFGPVGVHPSLRGRGAGTALTLAAFHDMRHLGYLYAVICQAGPVEFYQRALRAIPIPESDPGAYTGLVTAE